MWLKHISEGESLESVCGSVFKSVMGLIVIYFNLVISLSYVARPFFQGWRAFFPNLQGLSINLCFCQGLERNVVSVL